MTMMPLTIDPSGFWSPVQARKVLEIINPQARLFGIEFIALDITSFGMPHRRLMLTAHCRVHQWPVQRDSICALCLEEISR
jgi:hypothetical protein